MVLPDFHHKSKMELPSSVAVATTSTVRPDLTGSSVNCGMALIAVDSEVPDERAMERFMRAVRERYPYPTKGRRDLTTSEVVRSADQGAEFGVERWDAPPEDLERIEEGGRLDLDRYGGIDRLTSELPAWPGSWRGTGSAPSARRTTSSSCSGWRRSSTPSARRCSVCARDS